MSQELSLRIEIMKKILGIVLLILLYSNVTFAEILKFDCNYFSSWKVANLKTNLRIIDTEKNVFKILMTGNNNKQESYELPIKEFIGVANRGSGTAIISLNSDEIFSTFSWETLGEEHVSGTEYEGFFTKNISSCFLMHIPIDINLYRTIYSSYVIGKCEEYINEGKKMLEFCLARYQQAEINILKNKQDKCRAVRQKIDNNNARASTDAGNFLLGILNGMNKDLACSY